MASARIKDLQTIECIYHIVKQGQERGVVITCNSSKDIQENRLLLLLIADNFFPKIIVYIKADKYTLKFYLDAN